jgi:hypothetical protein
MTESPENKKNDDEALDTSSPLRTTAEVALRLRVTTGTMDNWAIRKVGPRFIRDGRRRLYPDAAVEGYLSERARNSASGWAS